MEMKYVVPDMAQSFGTLEFAGESEPIFERDKNNRKVIARRSYNLYSDIQKGTLLNYYPIKASMILVDPTCGAEYGYTYHIFPAFITIVLTFLISMIILANKKKEPGTLTVGKKKKAVRKKGW